VLGGYRYHDAQTDDARLTLRVLREGVRRGGTARSYTRAVSLLRDTSGHVRGVVLRDERGPGKGKTAEVTAKAVINATGAWADELRKVLGEAPKLRKIRGSHLVFPRSKVPVTEAMSFMHPRDQRGVFAVPWEGVTLVGTTDVDHDHELDEEPRISSSEADYILEGARKVFPGLGLVESDVLCTYSGVRPVIDTGKTDPSKESREHAVWHEKGLVTITGGKLTTWALMAREALEAARREKSAPIVDALEAARAELGPLPDRAGMFDRGADEATLPSSLSQDVRRRLAGRLGEDATKVVSSEADLERIGDSISIYGELRLAARDEGCVSLADLLLRRVRVGLTLPEGGRHEMAKIRATVQPELGLSDAEWEAEEAEYHRTWRAAYAPPTGA
jgi:glycerol-3-phosphate dehydrogenase